MVELQDLFGGHGAQLDLGLADGRVHPLVRRREDADLSEHLAGADLDREIEQSDRAAEHQVEFLCGIAAPKQHFALRALAAAHHRDQPLHREIAPGRRMNLLDQGPHLDEPKAIQRQEDRVQDEDGVNTPAEPIGHERNVAQDANEPQRDHRLHVEGQEDQRRSQVARQLDPVDPHGVLLLPISPLMLANAKSSG